MMRYYTTVKIKTKRKKRKPPDRAAPQRIYVYAKHGKRVRSALSHLPCNVTRRIGRVFRVSRIHIFSDRKSTRLNSSHQIISYAVFCLKKKTNPAKLEPPT